jgi:hypothetical protein
VNQAIFRGSRETALLYLLYANPENYLEKQEFMNFMDNKRFNNQAIFSGSRETASTFNYFR